MATRTKLLAAEEFWELPSSRWSELIDGVVVETSPPGGEHGRTQAKTGHVLFRAEESGVGYVIGAIGFILRRNPDLVRAPDVGFVRREHVPSTGFPKAFWEGAPDLAVEVVSPGDRPGEIQTKIREWLEAGSRQVWCVYPDTHTVQVVRSLQDRVTLKADDTLDGGDAVPGFSCRVSELFD
jgi:Uma2 family endonuclease